MVVIPAICALLCISFQLASSSNIGMTRQDITLSSQGGYGNILIAIDEAVPEDRSIITNLREYFSQASTFLLQSTKNQTYFETITILVPSTWSHNPAWSAPTDESVARARVIVGAENLVQGNRPYTLQPGLCAEEGDFIHLTPQYLAYIAGQGNNPGKKLVRQFAHLKWGLFDEDIPVTDNLSPYFYTRDNMVFPTLCVEGGFEGTFQDGEIEGASCSVTEMGTVISTCRFVPETATGKASIMYDEQFESVVEFCATDSGGTNISPLIQHNKFAPNRQNRLCNTRSAWDILNTLPDFADNHYTNREEMVPYDPTFTIVQEPGSVRPPGVCPQDIVCLSLDTSGSMDDFGRINKMAVAVKKYIKYYLSTGSLVGIVRFSSDATVLAQMTEITDDTVRETLAAAVPTVAAGGTSIGSGLQKCVDILRSYTGGDDSTTVRIMLLGDGEQNEGLTVSDVQPEILQLGISVDTIAYSFDADTVLSSLSQMSGGYAFFTSDNNPQNLNTALIQTIQRQCELETILLLVSELVALSGSSVTREIYIDNTIGLDTTIVISYINNIDVTVSSPSPGQQVTIGRDTDLKIVILVLLGQANGLITYTITNVDPSTDEALVVVITSKPALAVPQLSINTRLSSTDISFEDSTEVRAFVEIFQGYTPVSNLFVQALIESANGDIFVDYNDFGLGVDSTPNDGIYSAALFAHQFTGDGYYSFHVAIYGEGFLPLPDGSGRKKRQTSGSSLGNVTRVISGGLAIVDNWVAVGDLVPPQRIQDLQVIGATNNGAEMFTLQWTAPGDDLNIGTVSGYEIEVYNDTSLTSPQTLPVGALVTDPATLLVMAGETLTMEINADNISPTLFGLPASASIPTYYFRVRTYDDATPPNQADWSNPVSASVLDPNVFNPTTTTVPTVPTTTTITTTVPTTVPTSTTTSKALVLGLSIGILGFVALALAIGVLTVFLCRSKNGQAKAKRMPNHYSQDLREVKTMPVSAYGPAYEPNYYPAVLPASSRYGEPKRSKRPRSGERADHLYRF